MVENLTAFPGSYQGDEGVRADREEMWKEYMEIRAVASADENSARVMMESEGNPRGAQVYATLAVAARLESLAYLLSKMRSF